MEEGNEGDQSDILARPPLQHAVRKGGQPAAHLRLKRGIDVRHDYTRSGGPFGDDLAPGIDHHAVAVRLAAVQVLSPLSRREHPGEVLDRAGAQQRLPMRASGRCGERLGHQDDVHGGERAVELGKAHVVTHGNRDAPER